jgi:hypothetical protein
MMNGIFYQFLLILYCSESTIKKIRKTELCIVQSLEIVLF